MARGPICCELWPGNTTDVTTLIPIVDRLWSRFKIRKVCIVADRGMISKETIQDLEEQGWPYILGARMRRQNEVCDQVLADGKRFQVVHKDRKKESFFFLTLELAGLPRSEGVSTSLKAA
jgi:transposase